MIHSFKHLDDADKLAAFKEKVENLADKVKAKKMSLINLRLTKTSWHSQGEEENARQKTAKR